MLGVLCRLKLSQRLLLGLKLSQPIVSRVCRHVHRTKIYLYWLPDAIDATLNAVEATDKNAK